MRQAAQKHESRRVDGTFGREACVFLSTAEVAENSLSDLALQRSMANEQRRHPFESSSPLRVDIPCTSIAVYSEAMLSPAARHGTRCKVPRIEGDPIEITLHEKRNEAGELCILDIKGVRTDGARKGIRIDKDLIELSTSCQTPSTYLKACHGLLKFCYALPTSIIANSSASSQHQCSNPDIISFMSSKG